MSNFNLYSRYYDLLYQDKDYKNESSYVTSLLEKYYPEVRDLLELGFGSGSHAFHLCRSGYNLTGIERSEEMIDVAISKNISNFLPIQGDISDFKLNKKFDAAISLFHVISYLTDNDSLINCFNLTHEHLKANGLFLFDVWYSPAVYIQRPENRIKNLEDDYIRVTRKAKPNVLYQENIIEVNFEILIENKDSNHIEVINETHPMRHFSIPEIKLLAKFTGFEFLLAEEFCTGKTPDETTWGVCFLLKKNG
jgi:SAM-dependent methyltransferase